MPITGVVGLDPFVPNTIDPCTPVPASLPFVQDNEPPEYPRAEGPEVGAVTSAVAVASE